MERTRFPPLLQQVFLLLLKFSLVSAALLQRDFHLSGAHAEGAEGLNEEGRIPLSLDDVAYNAGYIWEHLGQGADFSDFTC